MQFSTPGSHAILAKVHIEPMSFQAVNGSQGKPIVLQHIDIAFKTRLSHILIAFLSKILIFATER